MALTRQEAVEIGKVVADEIVARLKEADYDSLMLHSVVYMHGSPGIVIHEAVAKAAPMRCLEYAPGKSLCFKKGIIGALSEEQKKAHTGPVETLESPGLERRLKGWMGARDICKAEIESIPKGERLGPWLGCMSKELAARGITP